MDACREGARWVQAITILGVVPCCTMQSCVVLADVSSFKVHLPLQRLLLEELQTAQATER